MSALNGKPNQFEMMLAEEPMEHSILPLSELLDYPVISYREAKASNYGFSRSLARSVGVVPAVVMRFISYKVTLSKNLRDGKLWYYAPYREIASRYDFIHSSAVYRAIQRLESKGLVEVGNYNRRKADRTTWFTVSPDNRELCDKDSIFFSPEVARAVGYKAAIVYCHARWAMENLPASLTHGWLRIWPSDYAEVQPLSKLEIRSALRVLVGSGFLLRGSDKSSNCHYRLVKKIPDSGVYGSEATLSGCGARIPSI